MVLDFLVIVLFIIFIIVGWKKGAARTLLKLVSSFASYIIAAYLGNYLAQLIYDNYISKSIIDSISGAISQSGAVNTLNTDSLPLIAKLAVNLSGYDVTTALGNAVSNAPSAIASGVESAISPIVTSFVSFFLTVILIVVISFIMKMTVVNLLAKIFNLPLVGFVNRIFGAVVGFVCAFLLVTFLAYLMHIIIPNIEHMPYVFSESEIYNSYIFYHFYNGNIFYSLISGN